MNWPGLLLQLAPEAHPNVVEAFQSADTAFADFKVNTPLLQAHALAQASHETGGFRRIEENLNYSADGLMATWSSRFPEDVAKKLARNPEAIANRAYSGRMGNTQPGDGWRYRGRGIFQLTGRANYASMGRLAQIPLEAQPELALASRYLLPVALHYWNSRGLSALAERDDLEGITRKINGGLNGLEDRARWLARGKDALCV